VRCTKNRPDVPKIINKTNFWLGTSIIQDDSKLLSGLLCIGHGNPDNNSESPCIKGRVMMSIVFALSTCTAGKVQVPWNFITSRILSANVLHVHLLVWLKLIKTNQTPVCSSSENIVSKHRFQSNVSSSTVRQFLQVENNEDGDEQQKRQHRCRHCHRHYNIVTWSEKAGL
jgi:hypothetical protein